MPRALLGLAMCLGLLCAVPAAWAGKPRGPDGHAWIYFPAEKKLRVVRTVFAMVEKRGVTMQNDALFYLILLNGYYSLPGNLDVDLGNALADIALPIGDMTMADEAD